MAISQDRRGLPAVLSVFRRLDLHELEIYLDPEAELTAALEPRGLPANYLISGRGVLTAVRSGAVEWDLPSERAELHRLIAASKSSR